MSRSLVDPEPPPASVLAPPVSPAPVVAPPAPIVVPAATYLSRFDPVSVASWVAKDLAAVPPESKNAIVFSLQSTLAGKPEAAVAYLRRADHFTWELRFAGSQDGLEVRTGGMVHW